jgi:translocation and assembly module TamB
MRRDGGGSRARAGAARWVLRGLLALVVLALLLVVGAGLFAGWAVNTTAGGQWVLDRLLPRLPVRVEATLIEGDLLGPLVLSDVGYAGDPQAGDPVTVGIDRLEIEWKPAALLDRRLVLERVEADRIEVDMPPSSEPFVPFDIALPLEIAIADLQASEIEILGGGRPLASIVRLEAAGGASGSEVRIERLAVTGDRFEASASGSLTTLGSYPMSFELAGSGVTDDDLEVAGGGRLEGDLDWLELDLQVDRPVALPLSLAIESPLDRPAFELTARLDELDPTEIDPSLPPVVLDGTVALTGTADAYRLDADVALRSEQYPDGRWSFAGSGDRSSFEIERAEVLLSSGAVRGTGSIAWQPELSWDLEVEAEDADPALLLPDWPGRLDLYGHTRGRWTEAGPDFVASVPRLEGELRGHRLRGAVDFAATLDRLRLDRLELISGTARLEAKGTVDRGVDVEWSLSANDLRTVHPDLRGSLQTRGSARGPRETPRLLFDLAATGLAWTDLEIDQASGSVDLTWNTDQPVAVRLDVSELVWREISVGRVELVASGDRTDLAAQADARRIRVDDREVDSVRIGLAGSAERHELEAVVVTDPATARARATGELIGDPRDGLEALSWRGRLTDAELATAELGDWTLSAPAEIEIGSAAWSASPACWARDGAGHACLEGDGSSAGGWRVRGDLDELPIGLFAPMLPSSVAIDGTLTADFEAAVDAAGTPSAALTALASGSLALGEGERRNQARTFRAEVLDGGIDPDGARLTAAIELPGSRWDVALQLPEMTAFSDPLGPQSLRGSVHGEADDLSPLEPLLVGVRHLSGSLTADTTLGGTVSDPTLVGRIELRSAMYLPALGVRLDRFDLEVSGDESETVRLDGEIESQERILHLTGISPIPPSAEEPAVIRLDGERFKLVDTPHNQIWISPRLQMTGHSGSIEIGGELDLPRGEIEIEEAGRDALPVSADVVVVGGEEEPSPAGPTVVADVRVNIGDSFSVSGPGFQARLGGSVRIVDDGSRSPIGQGQVTIGNGSFRGYGQDLRISDGRVIFTGGPIDNPSLNIPAYRQARDGTIAGIRIRGTLERPEAELYSIPPLHDSEILSYILTGNGSNTSEIGVDNTAASLGLAQSTAVLNELGFQNVSLRTDGSLDEAEIVLGRYLRPGLWVSYGIGVFEQLNTLRLRYEMSDNWAIEVDSNSQESGADLFYTFEK